MKFFCCNIFLIYLLANNFVYSQKLDSLQNNNKITLKIDGFVKSDFWYDSRQVEESRELMVLLYPKKTNYDKNGNDINGTPSFNFSAITSRFRIIASSQNIFKAKPKAIIEGDFSGVTNNDINGFRLRHAILLLNWEKAELLLGNFWHPMFVTDVIPDVFSLNTGVPFQPFIRNPQITFTRKFKNVNVIFSTLTQRDYTSDGPLGRTYKYLSYAKFPNIHFQFQYKLFNKHTFGLAADVKSIRPYLVSNKGYINENILTTYSYMSYYKFNTNNFSMKSKVILGQNLTEHLLLGGYAIKEIDSITGITTYTSTNHIFSWIQLTYGNKIKPGLFLAYAKNLGTTHPNINIYYGTGNDISYMYRITPNISYLLKHFWISLEFEHTFAAFGKGKPNDNGLWTEVEKISNNRILLVVMYLF